MTCELLEEQKSVFVPSAEALDHERLEGNALSAAVFQVGPVFGRFTGIDGGGGAIGRLEYNGFLRG